jgi:hypothetical protein
MPSRKIPNQTDSKKALCVFIKEGEERCWCRTNNRSIVVKEKGIKATLMNPAANAICKLKIDGCLLKGALAADYAFHGGQAVQVVELKGSDIERGIQQVVAIVKFLRGRHQAKLSYKATIVANRCPKFDGIIRKKVEKLRRDHSVTMRVLSSNGSFQL